MFRLRVVIFVLDFKQVTYIIKLQFIWSVFVVFLNPDAVFLILYKELYYRHIYAKVSVSTPPFICNVFTTYTIYVESAVFPTL